MWGAGIFWMYNFCKKAQKLKVTLITTTDLFLEFKLNTNQIKAPLCFDVTFTAMFPHSQEIQKQI